MILKTADFLSINYGNYDFIINRYNIVGSISYSGSQSLPFTAEYFNGLINYGEMKIISFDIDRFLSKVFKLNNIDKNEAKISIIGDLKKSSYSNYKERFKEFILTQNIDCSPDLFSFLISFRSEVKRIEIRNLKIFPKILKNFYKNNGFLGCTFKDNNSIVFFIDIEKIIFDILLKGGIKNE